MCIKCKSVGQLHQGFEPLCFAVALAPLRTVHAVTHELHPARALLWQEVKLCNWTPEPTRVWDTYAVGQLGEREEVNLELNPDPYGQCIPLGLRAPFFDEKEHWSKTVRDRSTPGPTSWTDASALFCSSYPHSVHRSIQKLQTHLTYKKGCLFVSVSLSHTMQHGTPAKSVDRWTDKAQPQQRQRVGPQKPHGPRLDRSWTEVGQWIRCSSQKTLPQKPPVTSRRCYGCADTNNLGASLKGSAPGREG